MRAVRTELFADEAVRRGLGTEPGEAQEPEVQEATLVQSLISQELEEAGADRDTLEAEISDGEARSFYEEHRFFFEELASVELYAVVVEDPALARDLSEQAVSATDEEFAALVHEHSKDRVSKAEGGYLKLYEAPEEPEGDQGANGSESPQAQGGQEEGPPDEIDQVGRMLLEPGRVGLARSDRDGRYYVLRSGEVNTDPPRGSATAEDPEAIVDIVKAQMIEGRQEQVLAELEANLIEEAGLEADEQTLYRLSVPDY